MNTYYIGGMPISDELYHHGILGQKWGIRRFQNPDGTYTVEGKNRYNRLKNKYDKQVRKKEYNDYRTDREKARKYKRRHSIWGRYFAGGNVKSMNRFDRRIAGYEVKSAKANKKAEKIVSKILDEFGSLNVSDLRFVDK